MNQEQNLDSESSQDNSKPFSNVHYVREDLLIEDRKHDLLYGNWAGTADDACQFIYQNRAINLSGIINVRKEKVCDRKQIWRYEHSSQVHIL